MTKLQRSNNNLLINKMTWFSSLSPAVCPPEPLASHLWSRARIQSHGSRPPDAEKWKYKLIVFSKHFNLVLSQQMKNIIVWVNMLRYFIVAKLPTPYWVGCWKSLGLTTSHMATRSEPGSSMARRCCYCCYCCHCWPAALHLQLSMGPLLWFWQSFPTR